MEKKKYLVELVTKDAPYVCIGCVRNTSIAEEKLNIGNSKDSLIVEDKETMDKVLSLISKHNSNRDNVRVMDWITEVGSTKRVFNNNIVW